MRTFVYATVAALMLTGLNAVLAPAQGQDIEGSKDHPLVTRYPGSVIEEYRYGEFDELTLPLGKTNDNGIPAKSQHLEGKITRIGYAAPAHRSILEIYRNYETALKNGGFEILFSCANNEACGDRGPTLWQAQGGEDWGWNKGHRYLAAKLSRPEGDAYVSLHVGQWSDPDRGASIVLYVVETKPMETGLVTVNAASLANDINRTGHASVYGIYFDTGKADIKPASDATLKEIAKLLQENAGMKLYVVGHTDNQGGLEMNMELSERRAQAVLEALTAKYAVPAARLKAFGSGPYSPVASNDSEEGRAKNRRVELVKQ
jgi:OmpA-OmpF porin, OOP family